MVLVNCGVLMFYLGALALSLLFCFPLTPVFLHPRPRCLAFHRTAFVCAATGEMSLVGPKHHWVPCNQRRRFGGVSERIGR